MEPASAKIKGKRLFLLDIDGTIAFEDELFDGSLDFLRKVRENGGEYAFITNNSTKSRKDYVAKFERWGIPADEGCFLTASYAACLYLRERRPEGRIFVLGTRSFVTELAEFGLPVTEDLCDGIGAAVVGYDSELTYGKLWKICELLQTRDVQYYATNPDLACPVGFGFVPDCGSICGMIENATGRRPVYLGKPSGAIVDLARERHGCRREDVLVVGDRLYTDIACGIAGGVDTAVVFTGEAKPEDLRTTKFVPTYYCDSVADLYRCIC